MPSLSAKNMTATSNREPQNTLSSGIFADIREKTLFLTCSLFCVDETDCTPGSYTIPGKK